jgi:hypothetical protein
MALKCTSCGRSLEADWVACPKCGMPVTRGSSEAEAVSYAAIAGLATKLVGAGLELGLLRAEAQAEKMGDGDRAEKIAVARRLAKELWPIVSDVLTRYMAQKRDAESRGGRKSVAVEA